MKVVLTRVEQAEQERHEDCEAAKYVRKNWIIFLAYYAVASLAVGAGIAGAMFALAFFGVLGHDNQKPMPVHDVFLFALLLLGAVCVISFIVQLATGPLVFTRDVVCKKCHSRLRVNRIAFLSGKYTRPPRCGCGGRIEPAFLWKPDFGEPSAISPISASREPTGG
jgi:hypothetical protein